ncbi:MAG: glycosyltransferase family 61 protein [Niabella sp.]
MLPVKIRKTLFLVYNKARIATIDKLLFPGLHLPQSAFFLYKRVCPLKDYNIRLDDSGDRFINKLLSYWNSWTEEEYIYVHTCGGLIEPAHGWHITNEGKLNYYSLGLSRAPHQKKPSFINLKKKKEVKKVNKLISLRDTGEENYFHFYNDVLAKLFFLEENGFRLSAYHVLITEKLAQKPFFSFYKENHPQLKNINWLVQGNDYITADEIVFAKPETHRMDLLPKLVAPFKLKAAQQKEEGNKKIFLSRSSKRLRFIENMNELEPLLNQYGFNIADADDLMLTEQITLFGKLIYLIGIHGAGFANLLYSDNIEVLIEIFPPATEQWLPFHYGLMAKQMGIRYIPVMGCPSKKSYTGGFYLSTSALNAALKQVAVA